MREYVRPFPSPFPEAYCCPARPARSEPARDGLGGCMRRLLGVPWQNTTGVPPSVPYWANVIVRPSFSRILPSLASVAAIMAKLCTFAVPAIGRCLLRGLRQLGPRIAQGHGAVEYRLAGLGVQRVHTEIAQSLE